jgi:hypothetical protein
MRFRRRRNTGSVVTEDLLLDLEAEDFVNGIVDPKMQRIAKEHGILRWTPIWQARKQRAFSQSSGPPPRKRSVERPADGQLGAGRAFPSPVVVSCDITTGNANNALRRDQIEA